MSDSEQPTMSEYDEWFQEGKPMPQFDTKKHPYSDEGPDFDEKFTHIKTKNEVRVTDPETGGQKGTKLARFDLIPVDALTMLAEHYGRGATKYADRNWERGYKWSLSYAAAQRHMNQFWGGEDIDEETGTLHVIAAAWHMFSLAAFAQRVLGTDDRS